MLTILSLLHKSIKQIVSHTVCNLKAWSHQEVAQRNLNRFPQMSALLARLLLVSGTNLCLKVYQTWCEIFSQIYNLPVQLYSLTVVVKCFLLLNFKVLSADVTEPAEFLNLGSKMLCQVA